MISTEQPQQMSTTLVADIALAFPQAIDILNKYGLDYCCHGDTPFTQACEEANLNPESVWQEIQKLAGTKRGGNQMNFERWTSSMLIDFIVQHHHAYVRESIPQITELLNKICKVHGDTNPELLAVRNDFEDLAEELLNHLPKEEEILFPAIKRLEGHEESEIENIILPSSLRMPMRIMEDEHEHAGDLIKSIRKRTNQYTVPTYACPTYQLAFVMLQEFDSDLMQHIHLENNILFPRAKEVAVN